MKTTILITTFKRPDHLRHSLRSLGQCDLGGCDIVVINDATEDETESIVAEYAELGLPVSYLFTGQRNVPDVKPRVPGFALNVAIRQSDADVLILSNSDVYHFDDTLSPILRVIQEDPLALVTVRDVYDDDGRLLECLGNESRSYGDVERLLSEFRDVPRKDRVQPPADPLMPYFMAVRREHLLAIGGYDEDFTGYACEDVDLTERLCANGCHYVFTDTDIVHLFHGARDSTWAKRDEEIQYNIRLLQERRGTIVRNAGRPWGVPGTPPDVVPNPSLVIPVFHSRCDYACRFCSQRTRPPQPNWTFKQLTEDLDDLWQDATVVNVGGVGEVGLCPHFNDAIDYFSSRGIRVCFVSNGYHLDVARLRGGLLDHATISLHSLHEPTYDSLTGTAGRLPQVLRNVRLLAERPRDYQVVVVVVVTELNVRQAPDVARFCVEAGVDRVRFSPLIELRAAGLIAYDPDLPMIDSPENLGALAEATEIFHGGKVAADVSDKERLCITAMSREERAAVVAEKMPTCVAPYTQVVIDLEGDVIPCCFLGGAVALGNIFTTPWTDIWNGAKYREFRQRVKSGTEPNCLNQCMNWG